MPAGAQIFDQFGNIKLDLSDRVGRWLFTVIVPAGPGSYSITNDGLTQGTPIPFANMYLEDGGATFPGDNLMPPNISFSGNTMFYTGTNGTFRIAVWVF